MIGCGHHWSEQLRRRSVTFLFFFNTEHFLFCGVFVFGWGSRLCRCVCVKEFQKREEHRCEGQWEEVLQKAFGELWKCEEMSGFIYLFIYLGRLAVKLQVRWQVWCVLRPADFETCLRYHVHLVLNPYKQIWEWNPETSWKWFKRELGKMDVRGFRQEICPRRDAAEFLFFLLVCGSRFVCRFTSLELTSAAECLARWHLIDMNWRAHWNWIIIWVVEVFTFKKCKNGQLKHSSEMCWSNANS